MLSPFSQFELILIQKPNFFFNFAISNFTIFLLLVSAFILFFYHISTKNYTLIPNNFQSLVEAIYQFILNLIIEQTGRKGVRFFPILFGLFNFICGANLVGLFPYTFTITAHIALTLFLALSFFFGWIIVGISTLGLSFFKIFLPSNVPGWLLPLLVVIEIISFLIRPISLSVRLFANMLAGHILLYILSTATISLGVFLGIFPILFIFAFMILELGIAFLQAYVFTILLSIYLADSYKSH